LFRFSLFSWSSFLISFLYCLGCVIFWHEIVHYFPYSHFNSKGSLWMSTFFVFHLGTLSPHSFLFCEFLCETLNKYMPLWLVACNSFFSNNKFLFKILPIFSFITFYTAFNVLVFQFYWSFPLSVLLSTNSTLLINLTITCMKYTHSQKAFCDEIKIKF
jgi:hypothetical protein